MEPATCLQGCSSDAVLDVRPLNNKCSKIAEIQSTSVVDANNTDGTNTHCADSSSCADSVDRHVPVAHHNTGTHNVCTGGDPGDHRMSLGGDPVSAAAVELAAASCGLRTASSARFARVPRRSMRRLEPLLAQSADRADSASWCELVTSAVGSRWSAGPQHASR